MRVFKPSLPASSHYLSKLTRPRFGARWANNFAELKDLQRIFVAENIPQTLLYYNQTGQAILLDKKESTVDGVAKAIKELCEKFFENRDLNQYGEVVVFRKWYDGERARSQRTSIPVLNRKQIAEQTLLAWNGLPSSQFEAEH